MNFLQRQLEDPVRFSRIKRAFYGGLVVVAVVEIIALFLFESHPHFAFESWPAWGSLYGLISCVLIIVISKLIGKVWLMRREDYYAD